MTGLPGPTVCPVCGQVVTRVDVVSLVRAFAGLPATERPDGPWHEVHERVTPGGAYGLTLRPHTERRCVRAAVGDPEPLPPVGAEALMLVDDDE